MATESTVPGIRIIIEPKPAEPEPNRDFEHAPPSAVRAILDDLPIHIRPNLPAARVQGLDFEVDVRGIAHELVI